MVSISPKERERERKRKRKRKRKRSRRIDAQRRESTKSTSPRPFEMVPSRKNEKTARSSRPSLWGNRIPPKEREREREPAECPTATAHLDRPVREQVILQILQNVTQTHAIATSKTPSLRSQSARVKLVPVQRRAVERTGTRGNTF